VSYVRPLLLASLTVALLAACAPSERREPAPAEKPPVVSSTPQDGGTLIRRLESDINTLNFVMHTTEYEKDVLSYIHAALVEIDKELKIAPGIAESWTVSPDGKLYTFKLNPAATFSDGRPVTARDVVFTLRKIVDPKSESVQLAGLYENLDLANTKAIDPHNVQVAFTQSRASQLYAFNIAILPEHFYARGNFKSAFNRSVLGAGPYVLREIKPGQTIRLQRRSKYWREIPPIETVLFKVLPDDDAAWNAVKRGELDEMQITSDHWKREKNDPQLQERLDFRRFYQLGYDFIAWNTKDPLLADPRMRRALASCLDRRSIISSLFHGTARIMTGPFTPDMWAYNSDVKAIEYGPDAARNVFEELGWRDTNEDGVFDKDGKPLEIEMLLAAGNTTSAAQAQVFQQGLEQAGARLKVTSLDAAALFERVMAGNYQATMLGWNLDLDPDLYSILHSSQTPPAGQNFVFFSNPEVDRLIEQGRLQLDEEARKETYRQLHALLAEQQPYTWTVQVSTKWAINKRVRNVEEANGLGLFYWHPGPLQWWLAAPGTAPAPEPAR
jgi:peptide/nickel transport system substrate-binding protein